MFQIDVMRQTRLEVTLSPEKKKEFFKTNLPKKKKKISIKKSIISL
jgi:hypothetical protein